MTGWRGKAVEVDAVDRRIAHVVRFFQTQVRVVPGTVSRGHNNAVS
ncbi:MAG: hypothetical protein KDA81_02515 [Planctomycetaceae bacterium]|nr:hypothetical protein [Planctomycetaceae bacterium]